LLGFARKTVRPNNYVAVKRVEMILIFSRHGMIIKIISQIETDNNNNKFIYPLGKMFAANSPIISLSRDPP